MSTTNPYAAQVCDFNYTYQDDTPIVFVIEEPDANGDPSGTAQDISGRTYKMEIDIAPDPSDETNQIASLTGVVDGPNGTVTFSPTGGANGTFGGSVPETVFYDVVETTSGTDHTKIRGEITLDPRITDKGVI